LDVSTASHSVRHGFDDHFPSTALLKAAVLAVVTAFMVREFHITHYSVSEEVIA